MCVTASVSAQVFTPTQAPRVRSLALPEELQTLTLQLGKPECEVPQTQKPHRVLESIREEAQLLRNVINQASGRIPRAERSNATEDAFDDVQDAVKDSVVDFSVANRPAKWTAAMVKGESSARRLAAFDFTNFRPDPTEITAINRAKGVATCLADWLATRKLTGPPADLAAGAKNFWFLPGAGVTPNEEATEVSLKAAEFYFSNRWRLYLHSTVTIEAAKPATETGEETDAGAAPDPEAAAEIQADAVAESVKTALLNPYGAPLYLTTGYLRKIRTPFFDGDANDGDHGLFLDSRLGLKFLTLPEESLELIEGQTTATAFYVGSAALRLRLPLYSKAPFEAGDDGIDVALTAAANRISNPGASTLFQPGDDGADPLIPKLVYSAHLAIGVSLPRLANVVISGTLWSNTKFDRKYQISINLQKSEPDAAPSAPASADQARDRKND